MFTYSKFIIMIDIDTFKHFFDNIRIFRFIMRYCQLTIEKRKMLNREELKLDVGKNYVVKYYSLELVKENKNN